jgi:YfiH family protein
VPVTLNLVARSRGDLPLYCLEGLREFGVDAVITGRRGGVSTAPFDTLNLGDHVGDDLSSVVQNRRLVAEAMGVDATKLVTQRQVHGAVVNDVDSWNGDVLVGDALVSTRDDVALAALVADCVPLLVVDPRTTKFAVVHAGWRGLVAGVITATLAHFHSPGELRVVIGPHISPARYQVGPEVAAHFDDISGACLADAGDRRRLDLAVVTLSQLTTGGVIANNVTLCNASSDDAAFFSDRAQRPCGRFGLVARRTSYDARVGHTP